MPIRLITENSWDDIVKVQEEAYTDIQTEDVNILKGKWLASPKTCAVYSNHENKIIAYLLAHPWASKVPPRLYEEAPITNSSTLYIHDLALTHAARGKNIARQLVENLIDNAKAQGFVKILLVAIQNSSGFWAKFGFIYMPSTEVCPSYGKSAQLMVLELKT